MSVTIGISLKMYFGYDRTLRWCRVVADLVGGHPVLATKAVPNAPASAGAGPRAKLFVLPAFPAVPAAAEIFRGTPVAVGAQNLAEVDSGAFTGEVGGAMLREAGARYVEVGHAERRTLFGETETVVANKTAAALRNGLVPVLCLGEADRMPAADAAIECVRQLASALAVSDRHALGWPVVVAYEPFWAIGADEPAADDHIATVCAALRTAIRRRAGHPDSSVIYGGSAGPGLLSRLGQSVDGLFLGRFAHEPLALDKVLDEAHHLVTVRA